MKKRLLIIMALALMFAPVFAVNSIPQMSEDDFLKEVAKRTEKAKPLIKKLNSWYKRIGNPSYPEAFNQFNIQVSALEKLIFEADIEIPKEKRKKIKVIGEKANCIIRFLEQYNSRKKNVADKAFDVVVSVPFLFTFPIWFYLSKIPGEYEIEDKISDRAIYLPWNEKQGDLINDAKKWHDIQDTALDDESLLVNFWHSRNKLPQYEVTLSYPLHHEGLSSQELEAIYEEILQGNPVHRFVGQDPDAVKKHWSILRKRIDNAACTDEECSYLLGQWIEVDEINQNEGFTTVTISGFLRVPDNTPKDVFLNRLQTNSPDIKIEVSEIKDAFKRLNNIEYFMQSGLMAEMKK